MKTTGGNDCLFAQRVHRFAMTRVSRSDLKAAEEGLLVCGCCMASTPVPAIAGLTIQGAGHRLCGTTPQCSESAAGTQ